MSSYWNQRDAAIGLANALDDVKRLDIQASGYDYSIPESLRDDQNAAAERVTDAVRYLLHGDEDEDES